MPFVTEEIWHAIHDENPPARSIGLTRFPQPRDSTADTAPLDQMALLQELIVEIRGLRKEIGVEEKAVVPIELRIEEDWQPVIKENQAIIERLARVTEVRFVTQISAGLARHSTSRFDVAVVYERRIDVAAERDKLAKAIANHEKIVANAERQLNNPGFTAKAPAHIVDGLKKQRDDAGSLLDKARAALRALPPA
jgi:valyl-tRNA synthetase